MSGLDFVTSTLRNDPTFVAGRLALLPRGAAISLQQRLGVSPEDFRSFELCRWPSTQRFRADSERIAGHLDVGVDALAHELRVVDAVITLAGAADLAGLLSADESTPMLAAAFDDPQRTHPLSAGTAVGDTRADRLLATDPSRWRESADRLQSHIEQLLPVAVVSLEDCDLRAVQRWLGQHGLHVDAPRNQRLAGLLIAWRGRGLVFVDRQLNESWLRLVLAHEVGHFVLDHHSPRARLLDENPALLEVFDGLRAPTEMERFSSSLYDLQLAPTAHHLRRDSSGNPEGEVADSEDAATMFALDLLCPLPLAHSTGADIAASYETATGLKEAIQRRLAEGFGLPSAAAEIRARQVASGIRPRGPFDA